MVYALLGFLFGLVLGGFLSARKKEKPIGNLRVDRSDPTEPPYLFLELETDISTICAKKSVSLKVKREDFLPHE